MKINRRVDKEKKRNIIRTLSNKHGDEICISREYTVQKAFRAVLELATNTNDKEITEENYAWLLLKLKAIGAIAKEQLQTINENEKKEKEQEC